MTKFDCNSSNEQELHSHVAITQPANAIKHHLKRYSGCTGPRQQQMPEASVYGLLQAFQADKSAARLIHALEELAGRLEVRVCPFGAAEWPVVTHDSLHDTPAGR